MTVRSLNETQKGQIADLYFAGHYTVPELAALYERSSRTINRALEEKGCSPVKHRKPKPAPVPVVIPTKTPWWKRIFSNMTFTYVGRWPGPRA